MKLRQKINRFARMQYSLAPQDRVIDAAFALNNASCHYNAVAAVRAGRADSVWLVWVDTGDIGVVHFINGRGVNFFDETWHDQQQRHSYRLIRKIDPAEYDEIYERLVDCKWALVNMFGTPWQKWRMRSNPHRYL